ncbi:hypothetical protein SO802_001689 [Lithocarpus litseifolius]|uniref:RNase H type-1 domain-containing protein n=1 Tax=Lithocarpus litseifolius TaxID=425828 RepID=A0AAW2DZC9_9ROSI
MEAELWVSRDGSSVCRELNLSAVEIESDAKVVLGWISNSYNYNLHHATLILDCTTLISQIPQVRMNHYFHEANKCVDALTRKDSELDQDLIYFDSPPIDTFYVDYDIFGVYYERLCS